ncbi:MAG: low molecular weight phosphotyrosine protein phosphatase, partial [Verrucomicrobiales bacterium]|nr:low molecular weight phosphotyrosine protein phosphatase [Verrucomicrobiales bacterium]
RQVTPADLENFDLILAADHENLADLHNLAKSDLHRSKLRLFCEFCNSHPDQEIPDPYYGGDAGFEHVLDLLEDGCSNLLDQLESGTL